MPEILPAALDELNLTFYYYPVDSVAGQEAVVRALARRMLAGELTPRELACRIQKRFGYELPLTERLAELDDEYDSLDYGGGRAPTQVDAEVTAEAHRLAQHPHPAPEPPDAPA